MSTPLSLMFAEVLAERDEHVSQFEHPHAFASEALKCSRQIGFRLLALAAANEPGLTSLLAFDLGSRIHDRVQEAFRRLYPETWKSETPWSLPPDNLVTGRADGFYLNDDGRPVVVEIKSMAPYKWAQANKRDMPHAEHALQAHLSAYVMNADFIHIVYVNKAGKMDDEPIIEWLAETDRGFAEIELMRLRSIVLQTNAGILPERFYDGEVVEDPLRVKWPCTWCDWRDNCVALPSEEQQLIHPRLARRAANTQHIRQSDDGTLKAM